MLVEAISARANVPVDSLQKIARSASKRYFEFSIKKRDGSERIIAHPSRSLKALQRWISRNVVGLAPVHPAATAYSKGSKISVNAARHATSNFTTRLDFKDFFPSFDSASVMEFFKSISDQNSLNYTLDDIIFVTRIVCRNGKLAIGAPSSPKITNAMMYSFDEVISLFAGRHNVTYTRYADDIFISGFDLNLIKQVENEIRSVVLNMTKPRLRLKEEKTLHLSRARHRSITGLVITPQGHVSLGRDRKRKIRTLVYLAVEQKLNPVERKELAGLLSFASDVEPDYISRLGRKFSINIYEWAKSL